MIEWSRMSRAERDGAYNNRAAVADYADWIARWTEMSTERREGTNTRLDIPYGARERNKIDIFPGTDISAPTLVYIHGGYWQMGSRDIYACMGNGVAAHGWSSVMVGYTLGPEASLTSIVAEIHAAIAFVGANAEAYGLGSRLVIAGWSAGGHLTAMGLSNPAAVAGLAISGIYELGPLRDTYLDAALAITDTEIGTLSPLRLPPVQKPLAIAYGTAELPPLVEDSRALHRLRSAAHLPGSLIPVPHGNHFDTLDELRKPDGILTRAALEIARS